MMAICALCLTLNCVKAQDWSADGEEYFQNSLTFEYQAVDNAFGIGATFVANHLNINFSLIDGDKNAYIEENSAWRIGAGYNHRFWLNSFLFLEGAVGAQYTHSKVKYDGGGKDSEGNIGMFVTPKVGLKLFHWSDIDWGIQAGYRWDFHKFKFTKEYTADYFTIGLLGLF